MKSIEVPGKTVDEAIFKGLDQMGLSIDEVDIEILEEGGKRFLGMGTKQCVIRLTEREHEEVARIQLRQEQNEKERSERRSEFRQSRVEDVPRTEFRPQPPVRDQRPRPMDRNQPPHTAATGRAMEILSATTGKTHPRITESPG